MGCCCSKSTDDDEKTKQVDKSDDEAKAKKKSRESKGESKRLHRQVSDICDTCRYDGLNFLFLPSSPSSNMINQEAQVDTDLEAWIRLLETPVQQQEQDEQANDEKTDDFQTILRYDNNTRVKVKPAKKANTDLSPRRMDDDDDCKSGRFTPNTMIGEENKYYKNRQKKRGNKVQYPLPDMVFGQSFREEHFPSSITMLHKESPANHKPTLKITEYSHYGPPPSYTNF